MKVSVLDFDSIDCDTQTRISQPKAVSETEEHDLAQLMAKAGQENAEVSGDDEEEEVV